MRTKNISQGDKEFTQFLREKVKQKPPAIKHAITNSFFIFNNFNKLKAISPPLSYFSLLTAEEEMVTALFLSIKRRGYANADKLNKNSHQQKASIYPFLKIINETINIIHPEVKIFPFTKSFNSETPLNIQISVPHFPDIFPDMPFNWNFKEKAKDEENFRPVNFIKEIENKVKDRKYKSIKEYIQRVSNLRNQFLYSSENGLPAIPPDEIIFYNDKKKSIHLIYFLIFLVDDYNERQIFVQQCLDAFLKMHQIIEK